MKRTISGSFPGAEAARHACGDLRRRGFPMQDIRLISRAATGSALVIVSPEAEREGEAAAVLQARGAADVAPWGGASAEGRPSEPPRTQARTEREDEIYRATHTPGGKPRDVF